MLQYLVPKNLKTYLSTYVEASQLEDIVEHLTTALKMEFQRLKKKTFGTKTVYSIDINVGRHYHRALFELVKFESSLYLMLRSFVWSHNYRHALEWESKERISREELNRLYNDEFEIWNSLSEKVPEDDMAMIYYKNMWYEPTPLQTELLQNKILPQTVIGPPGSGKTLLAMGFLQERARQHISSGQPGVLKLLYITESQELVRRLKDSWSSWEQEHIPYSTNKVVVSFLTFNQFFQWYADERNLHWMNDEEFLSKLSKTFPNEDPEKLRNELYSNGWMIEADARAKSPYHQSLYKDAGARNSLYSVQERQKKHPKLKEVFSTLSYVPEVVGTYLTETMDGFDYHFTVVDEAQKAPLQYLLGITRFTRNNQVLFIGDPIQKTSQYSSLSTLGTAYKLLFNNQSLMISHLVNTLRLPYDVARLANSIYWLRNNLNSGLIESLSYSKIANGFELTGEATKNICYFATLQEEQFAKVGLDANAAAIVLRSEDKARVKDLIQGKNAFTSEEAQGLEFSQVFLYLSKQALTEAKQIADLMEEKGITPKYPLKEHAHLSADKTANNELSLEWLSRLFIAISRTQGKLYVYWESEANHKSASFQQWFLEKLGNDSSERLIEAISSSKEEWLGVIHRFIAENAVEPAQENLQKIFHLNEVEAIRYIELCKKTPQEPTMDAFNSWRATLRAELPLQNTSDNNPVKSSAKTLSETVKVISTKPKHNQESQVTIPSTPSENKPTSLEKKQNYICQFLKKITIGNIKTLLAYKNVEHYLFDDILNDNSCLFIKIYEKAPTTLIQALQQEPQYINTLKAHLHKVYQGRSIFAILTTAVEQLILAKLLLDDSELCKTITGVHLTQVICASEGIFETTASPLLFLARTRTGQTILKRLFEQNPELANIITNTDLELEAKSIQNDFPLAIWHSQNNELKVSQLFIGAQTNASAFYWLSTSNAGQEILKLLLDQNVELAKTITAIHLQRILINEQKGHDSAFYYLSLGSTGKTILKRLLDQNAELATTITAVHLCPMIPQLENKNPSPLNYLTRDLSGRIILKQIFEQNPKLAKIITAVDLCRIVIEEETKNFSALYGLSLSLEGLAVLEQLFDQNEELVKAINAADLCQIVTERKDTSSSVFDTLSSTPSGLSILMQLFKQNEKLTKTITAADLTQVINLNPSVLCKLSLSLQGKFILKHLLDKNPMLAKNLTITDFFRKPERTIEKDCFFSNLTPCSIGQLILADLLAKQKMEPELSNVKQIASEQELTSVRQDKEKEESFSDPKKNYDLTFFDQKPVNKEDKLNLVVANRM
ncbi:MAG: hypothetical protein QM652_07490 [Legionella sp.]|uniref:hypothetical protein n=1 Tax=Legionella sp. TaxID=459 RepID=UPI0039E2AEAC